MGFHWAGTALCVLGIVCVGYANVQAATTPGQSAATSSDPTMIFVGMSLVLLGQLVQSCQIICEEYLLQDADMPEMMIVGLEGVWGVVMMLVVVWPLLWFLP